MRWTKWATASCILTALVLISAIVLPSRLSALGDLALLGQVETEDIGAANLAFVYSMTTAERILFIQKAQTMGDGVFFSQEQMTYPESQLSMDQVAVILQEELLYIYRLNAGPALTLADVINGEYVTIMDPDNPQRSITLWYITAIVTDSDGIEGVIEGVMDAETGRIYYLNWSMFYVSPVVSAFIKSHSLEQIAKGLGDYLELGDPIRQFDTMDMEQDGTSQTYAYTSDGITLYYTIWFYQDGENVSRGYSWEAIVE